MDASSEAEGWPTAGLKQISKTSEARETDAAIEGLRRDIKQSMGGGCLSCAGDLNRPTRNVGPNSLSAYRDWPE